MRTTRRVFLAQLCVLGAAPQVTIAQRADKVHRVALLLTTSPIGEMIGAEPEHPGTRVLLRELRTLGYEEGRNLVLERRSAEGKFERYPEIVSELARLKVDVIVAAGNNNLYLRAKEVSGTVPFVMIAASEPEKSGLVASLARPGGTFTGLTIDASPEIEAKRLEMLKELLAAPRRVAYLATREAWSNPYGLAARRAAEKLGLTLEHVEHTPSDYSGAFSLIERRRPDALLASFSAETFGHRRQIAEFALKARLPGIYPYQEMVEAGGLMSYGMSAPDLFRRAAHYVEKILKGARPGDLPVEQPTKFDTVINLKTAKMLGLSVPQSLLVRADRVIE